MSNRRGRGHHAADPEEPAWSLGSRASLQRDPQCLGWVCWQPLGSRAGPPTPAVPVSRSHTWAQGLTSFHAFVPQRNRGLPAHCQCSTGSSCCLRGPDQGKARPALALFTSSRHVFHGAFVQSRQIKMVPVVMKPASRAFMTRGQQALVGFAVRSHSRLCRAQVMKLNVGQ